MTKSRSAWLGLVVGLVIVAISLVPRVRVRQLLIACAGVVVLLVALATVAFTTRQLDREVLTESFKSLQYRLEYWQGTWALINESPRNFWRGVGPGNFGGPYLAHKLPASSEEIADPHNLLLDVWAASGLPAMLALLAAFTLALRNAFGRGGQSDQPDDNSPSAAALSRSSSHVLWLAGGLAWVLAVVIGDFEVFAADGLARWLVLGLGWSLGVLLLIPLYRQEPPAAWQTGAAACASDYQPTGRWRDRHAPCSVDALGDARPDSELARRPALRQAANLAWPLGFFLPDAAASRGSGQLSSAPWFLTGGRRRPLKPAWPHSIPDASTLTQPARATFAPPALIRFQASPGFCWPTSSSATG